MEILPLIIQLASGAIGGNVAGKFMPKSSLGTIGNSIAGIVGGGLGGQILSMLGVGGGAEAGSMDISSILTSIAGGGAGGGVLMAIVGFVKGLLNKK